MAWRRRGEDERDELAHYRKAVGDGLRGVAAKKKGGEGRCDKLTIIQTDTQSGD